MKDLTKGSISNHILTMAAPVTIHMLAQIAYQLVSLYFLTRIGSAATAGVNAASNAILVITALSQALGAGAVTLVAHAAGRKDQADANLAFNQSIILAAVCGAITAAFLYAFIRPYLRLVAADAATVDAGVTWLLWVLPGYALSLPMTVFSAALRGTGVLRPTVIIYLLTVILNAALAPVLIAGWGTGLVLGVQGAGLATTLSICLGLTIFVAYFHCSPLYTTMKRELMRPRLSQWRRILSIGLPAGGEFVVTFLYTAVVFYAIRDFGSSTQAGFSIGSQVLQTIMLPAMSIAFAAGPIAGQNFGARNVSRVRETFRTATVIGTALMLATTLLVQWQSRALVSMFGADASALDTAALFLQLTSWSLVAQCLVYTCTNMFQGLGNMLPSLLSSGMRFVVFTTAVMWLSVKPQFHVEQVWYMSIIAIALQAVFSLWLLHLEFRKTSLRACVSN